MEWSGFKKKEFAYFEITLLIFYFCVILFWCKVCWVKKTRQTTGSMYPWVNVQLQDHGVWTFGVYPILSNQFIAPESVSVQGSERSVWTSFPLREALARARSKEMRNMFSFEEALASSSVWLSSTGSPLESPNLATSTRWDETLNVEFDHFLEVVAAASNGSTGNRLRFSGFAFDAVLSWMKGKFRLLQGGDILPMDLLAIISNQHEPWESCRKGQIGLQAFPNTDRVR